MCEPRGVVDVADAFELTAAQARVLGSLIEKELATPDAYPLTLNALIAGCNQTTSRDPVVQYERSLVETTALALKSKGLLRVVHPGSGERATRYRQVLDETLGLETPELALLGVLLLRGAQTVPELKTRTERLHRFDGANDVEATLRDMSSREPPIVAQLDRAPGQREPRWMPLLEAGAESRAGEPVAPTVMTAARPVARVDELAARIEQLESRLATLQQALADLVELSGAANGD